MSNNKQTWRLDIIFIFFRTSKGKLAVIDCFQSWFFLLRLAVAKAFCQIETYDFAITCYAIILPLSLTLLFYLGFWHVLLPFIVYYIEEGQRKFFVYSVATLFYVYWLSIVYMLWSISVTLVKHLLRNTSWPVMKWKIVIRYFYKLRHNK